MTLSRTNTCAATVILRLPTETDECLIPTYSPDVLEVIAAYAQLPKDTTRGDYIPARGIFGRYWVSCLKASTGCGGGNATQPFPNGNYSMCRS